VALLTPGALLKLGLIPAATVLDPDRVSSTDVVENAVD
jgi:hypothetical protein